MAGTNLGTAYVQIVPSAQGISGSISKVMNGEAGSAGTSAGMTIASKIKGAIVAAGIGTAVVSVLKSSLSEGAELQQSYLGGLDTLYGKAADQARRYADEAVNAGISQSSYAEQAVSFGAALKQAYGGDTAQAVEAANTAILDMADNAAKMGTPLESIQDAYQGFAKQNYTMLDNLKLGYGGTKSEMERLLADAEELTGKEYNIDNLGDVYEAIHAIQEDLSLTGVAADEASTTFSGSLAAMKAAYDNLMGNMMLGENVGPAMAKLAETASTFLFDNLIPAIGNIFKSLPTAIQTFMKTGLPKLKESGTELIKSLTEGAKKNLPKLISDMMKGLTDLSGKLRSAFGKFVDLGLELIKSIALGIIKNIPTFIQTVPKIITNLAGMINDNAPKILAVGKTILLELGKGLINAVPVLIESIPQIIEAIIAVFTAVSWVNLGKLVITGLKKGLTAGISAAKSISTKIKDAIRKAWEDIRANTAKLWAKIKDALTSPFTSASKKASSIVSSIKSKLSSAWSSIKSTASSAWNKIKKAITSPIESAKSKLSGILNKIKGMFPLSIGKVFSNLKLPRISVKGGKAPYGIGGKGSLPSFSVSWNKKAMENPYLFSDATIFGAGEAGDEMLYGRKALLEDIREATGDGQRSVTVTNYITVNGADDPEEWADRLTRRLELNMRSA